MVDRLNIPDLNSLYPTRVKVLDNFIESYDLIKSFKINEYITLILQKNETNIYINGKKFIQCKYLLLDLDTKEEYEEINSIDEAEKYLNKSMELNHNKIDPETEFWGHCSNLQSWAENNYDTRLLHSNLSFPLLKKLYEIGDPVAKKVFKEEIANRFNEGTIEIKSMLYDEYFIYLEDFEKEMLLSTFREGLKDIANKKGSITINNEIYFNLSIVSFYRINRIPLFIDDIDNRLNQKEINRFLKLLNSNHKLINIKDDKIIITNGYITAYIKITPKYKLKILGKKDKYNFIATIKDNNKKYIITEKDKLYILIYEPKYDLFKLTGDSILKKLEITIKDYLFSNFLEKR